MSRKESNMKLRNYSIIQSVGQLKCLSEMMSDIEEFAFDTETNTLRVNSDSDEFSLVGISISWGVDNNYYIPTGHLYATDEYPNIPTWYVRRYLKSVFEREDIRVIGWNLKFDMHVMKRIGIEIKTPDLWDGMIMSWLCDENSANGLKENTRMIWGEKPREFTEVTGLVTPERRKENGLKANSRVPFSLVDIEDGALYAIDDAFNTFRNYVYLMDKLEDEGMEKIYCKMYKKFLRTLYTMEERGVVVDKERLTEMKTEIKEDLEQLMYDMIEMVGLEFNPSSNQHLAELLFGYDGSKNPNDNLINSSFKFKPETVTGSGMPQTGNGVLQKILKRSYSDKRRMRGQEFIKNLLSYKKLNKLYTAFILGIDELIYPDGKVHPNCNIIGTDSGRISMSEPNLQQLPKAKDEDKYQIRSLFIGSEYVANDEDGTFVSELEDYTGAMNTIRRKKIIALDYSNLEMRVLTHFSEDENLLEMFRNKHDSHGSTAVNMFGLDCTPDECKKKYPVQRQVGKVLNFLLAYGGGASALCDLLGNYDVNLNDEQYLKAEGCKNGVEVAQKYIDRYFDSYTGVAQFIKDQKKFAHRNGYVQTLIGRHRRLPHLLIRNPSGKDFKQISYEERLAVNSAIQGSAGDITINAQNRVEFDERLKELHCYMLIQIHDELVFECPEENCEEAISIICQFMSHPFGDKKSQELILPLDCEYDVGDSYQEAK